MVMEHRGIYSVPDDRHVPIHAETLGRHVEAAILRNEAAAAIQRHESEFDRRVQHHLELYRRWSRMARRDKARRFPKGHPIYSSVIVWELYVCRFDDDVTNELWMTRRSIGSRMKLCELSRENRRRGLASISAPQIIPQNDYDMASYSTH